MVKTLQDITWREAQVVSHWLLSLGNPEAPSYIVHYCVCNLESNTLKWILTGSVKAAASAPSEDAEAGSDVAPSAPEDTDPSAPVETFQSAECVICLERKVAFSSFLFFALLH